MTLIEVAKGVRSPRSRSNNNVLNRTFGVTVDNILFIDVLNNVGFFPAVEQFALLALGIATIVGAGLFASAFGAILEVIAWKKAQTAFAYKTEKRGLEVKAMKVVKTKMKMAHAAVRERVQMPFDPRRVVSTSAEDFWPEVVEETTGDGTWSGTAHTLSEISATLALIDRLDAILAKAERVVALANDLDMAYNAKVEIKVEADHHDCAPFGITPMGKKDMVLAATKALLSDLDGVGNPDPTDVPEPRRLMRV